MIDQFATLRQLVVPAGSLPGSPRIVIGPDVPANLTAFYAVESATVTAAILWYYGGTDYHYYAITSGNFAARGYTVAGIVGELDRYTGTLASGKYKWDIGATPGALNSVSITIGPTASILNLTGSAILRLLTTATLDLASTALFEIGGVSQPRGLVSRVTSTADSAAIAGETVLLTLPSATYRNGRAFRVKVQQDAVASLTGQAAVYRIRRGTTTAGAQVAIRSWPTGVGTDINDLEVELRNTSGSDVTQQMVLTLAVTAGTVTQKGSATTSALEVWDIGASGDFADAPAI